MSHWTVADAGVAHLRGVVAAAGAVDAETVLVRAPDKLVAAGEVAEEITAMPPPGEVAPKLAALVG